MPSETQSLQTQVTTSWRQNLSQDFKRYKGATYLPPMWWLTEKTAWAIAAFRLGQGIRGVGNPFLRAVLRLLFWPVSMSIHLATGVELWPETSVGPGLRIYHGIGLIVNPLTVIGSNATLYQGVTIGSRHAGKRVAPTIGDNVIIGAHAVVVGAIRVGHGVRIGANSVVVADVPDDATVVGPRSQVIERSKPSALADHVDTTETQG